MTKRKARFFRTLRFYNQDLFGRLVLKDPKVKDKLFIGFKNAKINKLLYERVEEKVERKRKFRRIGKEKFFYRTDTVKIRKRRRRLTKHAKRLRARLIIRKFATQMTVRQFRSYLKKAVKGSSLFFKFLRLMESRVDVVAFRMNFFKTSEQARQAINHGILLVNGRICRFSSVNLKLGDLLSVIDKNKFKNQILAFFWSRLIVRCIPSYLEVNFRILTGLFIFSPKPRQVIYPARVKPTLLTSIGKKFS